MYIAPVNQKLDRNWSNMSMAILFPLPLTDLSVSMYLLSGKWKTCCRPLGKLLLSEKGIIFPPLFSPLMSPLKTMMLGATWSHKISISKEL